MEVPRHWRLKKQRYALVGETCPNCNARLFPPRPVCPHCSEAVRQQVAFVQHEPALVIAEKQPVER